MAENRDIELGRFTFDVDQVVKSAAELKEIISKLRAEQKKLTESGYENSAEFVENAASLKALTAEYNKHIKVIADSVQAQADQANMQELINAALATEVTTIKEARESNKVLNQLRNSTNVLTKEGQDQLKLLNERLDANNALIKENVDQYTKQKINVGNYKEDIKDAYNELGLFNGGLSSVVSNSEQASGSLTTLTDASSEFSGTIMAVSSGISTFIDNSKKAGGVTNLLTNSLKGVTQGIIGMTKASLTFIATPIGMLIAALGVVLGSLYSYLTSTKEGIDAVTSVTRPLMAIMSALMGVLQKLGKLIVEAFTNPKKHIDALVNYVKDKVIKHFKSLADIVMGLVTLDFDRMQEGFDGAVNLVKEVAGEVKNVASAVNDFLVDAATAGAEIDRLTKEIEASEDRMILLKAENTKKIREQEEIMKDQSKTQKEINAALEEANRLSKELSDAEKSINEKKIQRLKIEQSLRPEKSDDESKMNELIAENMRIEDEEKQRQLKFMQTRNKLHNEEMARRKAAQDAFLKDQAEKLSLYKAEQGVRARTLEEQLKLEQDVAVKEKDLLKKNLDAQKISRTGGGR